MPNRVGQEQRRFAHEWESVAGAPLPGGLSNDGITPPQWMIPRQTKKSLDDYSKRISFLTRYSEHKPRNIARRVQSTATITTALRESVGVAIVTLESELVVLAISRDLKTQILQSSLGFRIH